ncbi:MAG: beta strand repeat-containing protein, partial [Limisphaerales bacterium]
GSDTFDFFAGDSVLTIVGSGTNGIISGYDTITDYTSAATASASEKISFVGVSVSSTATSSVDSTLKLHTGFAVTSDNVSNGIVTFNDTNGTNSVSLTSLADVAAAVQFLQAYDIGTTGSSLAFGATISGVTHTFLFIQGSNNGATDGNDVLIDLPHVSATSLSTFGLSNQLAVIGALAPAGIAGEPINLALTDLSGGQSGPITLTVTGIPSGWTLTEGTDNGDGSWTVQTDNIAALSITSLNSYSGALVLNVAETWTNADGSAGNAIVADNVEAYAVGSPIFALAANDYLTASGGPDEFVFAQPIGNDVIYSFDVVSDKIDLIGFNNAASFADIQANLTDDANGNAVITLGVGETITLQGVHAAALNSNDFVFDQTPVTTNAGSMTVGDGAVLPLGGTINNTGTIALNSTGDETDLQLIEHGVTLQGGGEVILSDSAENFITGTSLDVTLTNVDNTISGSGQLGMGQLTLVNEGTIDATGANALTIDTGANVVTNTGTLEATGTGGLTVLSAIANSGILWANGAAITVQGDVSGNGTAMINGSGTLDFEAASTANVVFAPGATGTLKLGDSFHFNGTISGFAGSDIIDLANLGSTAASVSYHENAAGSGGTLAVSDGVQTVELSLLGHYTANNFSIIPDLAKGTLVTFVPHDLIV